MPAPFPRTQIAPKGYEKRKGEIALVLSHHHLKHLHFIYRNFEGDLALAITLAEIAHHNATRYFSPRANAAQIVKLAVPADEFFANLEGCNAFSLSQATGIPRETIRRKIQKLSKLGWVKVSAKWGITITPLVSRHFLPHRNVETLNDLTDTCEVLRGMLAHD